MHSTQAIRTLRLCEASEERESDLAELAGVTYNTAAVVAEMRRVRTQIALANALTTVLQSRGIAS